MSLKAMSFKAKINNYGKYNNITVQVIPKNYTCTGKKGNDNKCDHELHKTIRFGVIIEGLCDKCEVKIARCCN